MGLLNATFATNPLTLPGHLACAASELAGRDVEQTIAWALELAARPVLTTNFRPGAAALIHLVTRQAPHIPVIWVDTGYNTPATYRYAAHLASAWHLNLQVYTPRVSVARQAARGGIPRSDSPAFVGFNRDMKLEPFERAFNELQPDVWFTGIRREQSDFRASLDVVSRGAGNSLRVAPLLDWQDTDIAAYLARHDIADNDDYVDPAKPGTHLECGIQYLR